MGRNNYFQFKQFTIVQDKASMKVGTDGVLLGSWAEADNPNSILDIGTGTGLIALMLAQRFANAAITAIDIDENAFLDATQNFKKSPWPHRINSFYTSLQKFALDSNQMFDLVVCNPPYFNNAVKSYDASRTVARHNDLLPFEVLVKTVSALLNPTGNFSLVLPFEEERRIRSLAANCRLFPKRITRVRPKPSKDLKRVLIEFRKEGILELENELILETENHHEYTAGFARLVKDFYLNL